MEQGDQRRQAAMRAAHEILIAGLGHVQELTGLESIHLAEVDSRAGRFQLSGSVGPAPTHPEHGGAIDWRSSPCRCASDAGVWRTTQLASSWPQCPLAGLPHVQSYVGVPIRDDEGKLTAILCGLSARPVEVDDSTYRTITVIGELTAALAREARDSRRNLDLLHLTAHELRRPLALASGYLSIVQDGSPERLPGTEQQALGRVSHQLELARGLVTNVLEAARLEARGLQPKEQLIDLRQLVLECVTSAESSLLPSHRLVADLGSERLVVSADLFHLRLAIVNVIENAVKYSPRGGEVRVSAGKDPTHRMVWVSVTDQGVGIDPDDLSGLFARFERVPQAGGEPISGTGLGLYLARQVLAAHRGTIHAASPGPGKGSTFTMELPAAEGA